jgi:putative aldouronate transport system substrate-binding protein
MMVGAMAFANGGSQSSSGAVNASGLPEVTLHFIFYDGKKADTDAVWNYISEKYKDKLNAKFDVQFVAGSDYIDKLLVKAAAGDKWDLNFEGDWIAYYQMANRNAYLPLDDLLPKYAPNLYKVYQQAGVLDATKINGKVSALPWTNLMSNRPFFLWRGDLISVDPATIKTVEDIDRLLHQLKVQYPTKYIVENAGLDTFNTKYNLVAGSFNFVFNAQDWKRTGNVTVQYTAETPAFRERSQYAERWQKDGLIWADVLVDQLDHNQLIDQSQLITKWGTHEFATATSTNSSGNRWGIEGAHWDYNTLYDDSLYPNRTPLANIVAIPRTSENPERTLMFLDLLETDQELYDLVHYGIQGKNYVLRDGTVFFPDGMTNSNSNYMRWGGRWALFKPQFMRPDTEYGLNFWANEKEFALGNPNNISNPLDGFSFNTESVTTEVAQIQQIYDAANKMLDVGLAGNADAAVDKLIADLNRAGLQKVKTEYQKQVDAFIAGRK